MTDVSVIMPVYNSEKYLRKTIESVLNQSYKNFELILVDDGSKDTSGEICDQFAQKDARVRVVHQKNGGICAARNKGLSIARGKYIAFCDNDDEFFEHLLSDNLALAFKYDADIVRFSRRMTTLRNNKVISVREMHGFQSQFIKAEDFGKKFNEINNTGEGIWAGIYKKSFLDENGIHFDETMKYGYEDLYFITQAYLCGPSVVLNDKVYYNWIMRFQHSTSGKTNINNIDSLIKGITLKEKLIKKYDIETEYPYLWVEELSKKIYTIVRYVSPKKVKMRLKDRLKMIRRFGSCDVFMNAYSKKAVRELRKKSGVSSYLVYTLFVHKCYLLLYLLIVIKQYIDRE